jgi:hypothetical protein
MITVANDYTLRGKCRELSEAAALADPSLVVTRGHQRAGTIHNAAMTAGAPRVRRRT